MPTPNWPDYFMSPPTTLAATAGAHRFVWDLRYTPPAGAPRWGEPAVLGRTPRAPMGPLVLPGEYRVVLTADGKQYTQALTVLADPHAGGADAALAANVQLSLDLGAAIDRNSKLLADAKAAADAANASGDRAKAQHIEDQVGKTGLGRSTMQLTMLMNQVMETDVAPSPTVQEAANGLEASSDQARAAIGKVLSAAR
jgi:hypothetical protein